MELKEFAGIFDMTKAVEISERNGDGELVRISEDLLLNDYLKGHGDDEITFITISDSKDTILLFTQQKENSKIILKRISKEEATNKYGVITTGINSQYSYFLREDGCVVDSDGDIRYMPEINKVKGDEEK